MPKSCINYHCKNCDYTASNKTSYEKHLLTLKHKNCINLALNSISSIEKMPIKVAKVFTCEKCNFVCNKQSNYNMHITTKKHLHNMGETESAPTNKCDSCEKEFNSYNSLWKHKKKCSKKPLENTLISDNTDASLIISLLKDNQEFKTLLIEQQKENKKLINKVIELSREPTTVNTNCNNNNNNFNLNLFLNETCKDAINMADFVKSIVEQLGLGDLEETARLGYVGGISRIFVNALSNMEVNKRPIHCTDIKRETVYIKDKDLWEKDKEKLKNAVDYVAGVNMKQIDDWKEDHPGWNDSSSQESRVLDKIYMTALGGMNEDEDDKNMKKVIKNVLQEVVLDKDKNC